MAVDRNGTVVVAGDLVRVEGRTDEVRVVASADNGIFVQWHSASSAHWRYPFRYLADSDRCFTRVLAPPERVP